MCFFSGYLAAGERFWIEAYYYNSNLFFIDGDPVNSFDFANITVDLSDFDKEPGFFCGATAHYEGEDVLDGHVMNHLSEFFSIAKWPILIPKFYFRSIMCLYFFKIWLNILFINLLVLTYRFKFLNELFQQNIMKTTIDGMFVSGIF